MSCKKDEEYILLDMLLYGQTLNRVHPQSSLFEKSRTNLSGHSVTKPDSVTN
ncbi:MAG: hypothetical protein U9P79_08015 [Candidatus Cloacimonadota bacterium]|nr:hypothetical protein [Candidatus Cloacimonadota bacterium]